MPLLDRPGSRPIIAVVGPTAMGKTAVAVLLAQALSGEIISADSVAVYRCFDIGTAKPELEERSAVPFHLVDVADPDEQFTAARFKDLAEAAIRDIELRDRRPIVAGGTGLYVRVLLQGFGLTRTAADPALRKRLDEEAGARGAPALHERLVALDPDAAKRIHPNDRIRIVRALEVTLLTGEPISAQQARDAEDRRPRLAWQFALYASRDELYHRINARVDTMVAKGLEGEVVALMARGYDPALTPMRSLGYKEMVAHLRGESDLESAVEAIKKNTRRFAKRQLTWFRAEKDLYWIDVSGKTAENVASEILAQIAVRENRSL